MLYQNYSFNTEKVFKIQYDDHIITRGETPVTMKCQLE